MGILVNAETRVCVQGITGRIGRIDYPDAAPIVQRRSGYGCGGDCG